VRKSILGHFAAVILARHPIAPFFFCTNFHLNSEAAVPLKGQRAQAPEYRRGVVAHLA
jgi:hypothetical protein